MWRAINPDGTLVYSFVESVKATFPFYVIRLLRRPAVPGRHADHGLERGHDGQERQARSAAPDSGPVARPRLSLPQENTTMANNHKPLGSREDRDQQLPDDRADPAGGGGRRPRRDRAAVLPALHHAAGRGPQALHRAAAGRARRLHPRGLLQLPLADGAAVPRRDAALRPLLDRRRVRLRPPVPVGQQAHRPGPAPRRRQVQRRMASRAPEQPARPGARVQHAGLPLAGTAAGRPGQHGAKR
jgi:hypothetical protein